MGIFIGTTQVFCYESLIILRHIGENRFEIYNYNEELLCELVGPQYHVNPFLPIVPF